MNNWIFVVTEYNDYNQGSIEQILKALFQEKTWRIGEKTLNKNSLIAEDRVIFYISGENNKYFIASCVLESSYMKNQYDRYGIVKLGNINLFNKKIFIKSLIHNLKFIKYKRYWGLSLQNGIIKIDSQDYKKILGKLDE